MIALYLSLVIIFSYQTNSNPIYKDIIQRKTNVMSSVSHDGVDQSFVDQNKIKELDSLMQRFSDLVLKYGMFVVGRMRDHTSAIADMESLVLDNRQKDFKELESLFIGFSESVLKYGLVRAASVGNLFIIKALLNYKGFDSNTIEGSLIEAAKGNHWKSFSLLVPFASEDSFKRVRSLENAYVNISNEQDLFQLVNKTRNYSLLLHTVLVDAVQNGNIDVVNAIFKGDSKLLHDLEVKNLLISYFKGIVSIEEFQNMDNLKDWIIIHGILLADNAKQPVMVKFLLSLIEISTENNLFIRTASYYSRLDLVRYALKHENVLHAGLENALRLAVTPEIREILKNSLMFFLMDQIVRDNEVAPVA